MIKENLKTLSLSQSTPIQLQVESILTCQWNASKGKSNVA